MRLKGWHVDGFGIFRDYEIQDLPDGLTIFVGPNEAGKSTLLAFLRGALFGFPDGRSREPKYPPLQGGRHGGRVVLTARGRDHIIERRASGGSSLALTLPDGQRGDEADLRLLVGGADDRLFRSVFAFSLTELQTLETLTAEGVRDRIFSAGIAGAGRSARTAMRELETRAAALLRPRSQARINQLLGELTTLSRQLDEAKGSAIQYLDWVRDEEARAAEIATLGSKTDEVRKRAAHFTMLRELWPTWNHLQGIRTELDAIEPVPGFPSGAAERLAHLVQECRAAEQAIEELKSSQQSTAHRLAALRSDDTLRAVAPEVEQAYETLALHRNLLSQIPPAQAKVTETQELLDERLRALGPDWDAAAVTTLDLSIGVQDETRAFDSRLARSASVVEQHQRDFEAAGRRRQTAQLARDRVTDASPKPPPDADVIDGQMATVRRLRSNLGELRAAQATATVHETAVRDRARAIAVLESQRLPWSPGWIARLLLVGLIASSLVAALLISSPGNVPAFAAVAAAAVAGLAYLLWQRHRVTVRAREQRDAGLDVFQAEHDQAIQARDEHIRLANEFASTISTDSATMNLPDPPSTQALEDLNELLMRQRSHWFEWRERQARQGDADGEIQAAADEVERAAAALDSARRVMAADGARWESWKAGAALPATLTTQGATHFFETALACREAVQQSRATAAEVTRLTGEVSAWRERARAVVRAAGRVEAPTDEELIEQMHELRRDCQEDQQARSSRAVLEEESEKTAAKIVGLQASLRRWLEERRQLYREAGAVDGASFRRRLTAHQRRAELQTRFDDLGRQVFTRIGRGPEAAELRRLLSSGRVEEWRTQADAAQGEAEELQRARDEAVARHRDAQRARLELESSADIVQLETEREGLLAELQAATRRRRVLGLARTLIEKTLREFERTRQPQVLAQASSMFAFVTHGRYERLVQREEGNEIVLMGRGEEPLAIETLSRGTAEQLYLCIRLALAAEFGRRSEPLPVVMDDVFVNFDPDRARAVGHIVAEFARTQQVLVFTCHPSTRDLLTSLAPQARVIELGAQGPSA